MQNAGLPSPQPVSRQQAAFETCAEVMQKAFDKLLIVIISNPFINSGSQKTESWNKPRFTFMNMQAGKLFIRAGATAVALTCFRCVAADHLVCQTTDTGAPGELRYGIAHWT